MRRAVYSVAESTKRGRIFVAAAAGCDKGRRTISRILKAGAAAQPIAACGSGYRGRRLELDEVLAVMLQLGNRLADIVQSQVRAFFHQGIAHFRRPTGDQFLEG